MMTNLKALSARIYESGYKKKWIAAQCGMSRASFYNKLVGKTEFTQTEIAKLKEILQLKPAEADKIFFG